eukprot:5174769-Amphidinium_carterae.2
MARQERDQLSAQVVQLQQQLAEQQQQQQAIQVSTPSGHIKLDSKLGRPLALSGEGIRIGESSPSKRRHTRLLSLAMWQHSFDRSKRNQNTGL